MGTNYYFKMPEGDKCECCGRIEPAVKLHIGKSSAGWAFSFQAYKDEKIESFREWVEFIKDNEGDLVDEYGTKYCVEDFVRLVESGKNLLNHVIEMRKGQPDFVTNEFIDPEGYAFGYNEFF